MEQPSIFTGEWHETWVWFDEEPENIEYMGYVTYGDHVDGGKCIFVTWDDSNGTHEHVCETEDEAHELLEEAGFYFFDY